MKLMCLVYILVVTFHLTLTSSNNDNNNNNNDKMHHEFLDRNNLLGQIHNLKTFFLTIVLPCSICLLVIIVLAFMMFGSRQGTEKRLQKTSAHELVQYYSVKNAFNNLRIRFNYYRDI